MKDEIQKNGRLYRELRTRVREDAARCLQRAVRSYLLNDDNSQKNDVVVKTWANVQELAQMSVKQLRREKRVVKRDLPLILPVRIYTVAYCISRSLNPPL